MTEISVDRTSARSYTRAEGLSGIGIWSLAEDRNGNLWLGSDDGGVLRIGRDGFKTFDIWDGLARGNRDGQVCAFTRGTRPDEIAVDRSFVECFDGARFHAQQPPLRPGVSFGWGMSQLVLQDERGEWWVPTIGGLYRFPAIPFARLQASAPRKIYTERDGLPSNVLLRLFQDARGNIWVGSGGERPGLAIWDRATDSFRSLAGKEGIPVETPTAFAEDRTGAVWIGFESGLLRFREGTMTFFRPADGLPAGGVRALHRDRDGRLWIGSGAAGVVRVDGPEEERPRFVRYGVAQGLSSESIFSLTDDQWGRIYAGTSRGVDRLDPRDGVVQHFTADEGLSHADIGSSLCDRQGNLWFGSPQGLSRLQPGAQGPKRPPDTRIMRVVADGVAEPLPDLGASEVRLRDLGPGSAPVQVNFLSIDFAPGGRPRYQYFLEGIDRKWSAPAEQRSIVYGRLPAGDYRFRVRSVTNDGSIGQAPGEVRFRILPPLWGRPEILTLAVTIVVALVYLAYRYRVRSLLAVERVRTRVASDLHDDIGAGLSEIAILSETVRREGDQERARRVLTEIGEGARNMVDSMSDIVWSTDPRNDDVASLAQRIRDFAVNVLESRGILWVLEVPPAFESQRLDPETRRQILLIAKEALTNAARHSHCSRASIRMLRGPRALRVEVEDDGTGLPPSGAGSPRRGHGLANMRARAVSLGGDFQIESGSAGGTLIVVRVPLLRVASTAAATGNRRDP
jgi:two-component sensor histidine kinase